MIIIGYVLGIAVQSSRGGKIIIFPPLMSGSVLSGVQKPKWAGRLSVDYYQSLHEKAEGSG